MLKIFLFFIVTSSLDQWVLIYDEFNLKSATSSTLRQYQECNFVVQQTLQTMTCSINGIDVILIKKDYKHILLNFKFPHYQTKFIFDAYFLNGDSAVRKKLKYIIEGETYTLRNYKSIDLQNYNVVCSTDSKYNDKGDVNTYIQIDTTSTNYSFNVNVCTENDADNIDIGLRNLQIYIKPCHYTCKECQEATFQDCIKCWTGDSPISGVCNPQCNKNYNYIQIPAGCLEECSRDEYLADPTTFQCLSYPQIKGENQYIESINSDYSPLTLVQDPYFFDPTFFGNRIFSCNSKKVFGPFRFHEAIQLQLGLYKAIQFIRLRFQFYYTNWEDDAKVQIFVDGNPSASVYQSSGSIQAKSGYFLTTKTQTCLSYTFTIQMIEFILKTTNSSPLITIQGYMNTELMQMWALRNITIDVGKCQSDCDICLNYDTCSICATSFYLHKGKCLASCPAYSTMSGTQCIDFDNGITYPKYLVKAFFDTSTSDEEASDLAGTRTNNETNFLTNNQNVFGYLEGKRILGGCLVWGNSKFTKVFDVSQDHHYAVSVYFQLIIGDNSGSFTYTLDRTSTSVTGSYSSSTIPFFSQSNIWCRSAVDTIFKIQEPYLPHVANQYTVEFDCIGDINTGFCGISDYFIILHKCHPLCTSCHGPLSTDCTPVPSLTNHINLLDPISCETNYYLDSSGSNCVQCNIVGCTQCTAAEICTNCGTSFDLISHQCFCKPGTYLQTSNNTCQICESTCLTCNAGTQNSCLSCYSNQFRMMKQNECACQQYFFDDGIHDECQPICGDMILVGNEECDDGNNTSYDGCFQCHYQCQIECLNCQYGKCVNCTEGYAINSLGKCEAICGDDFVAITEQCEPKLVATNQKCQNCQFYCEPHCTDCQDGICYQCDTSSGWYVDILNQCVSYCGDYIVNQFEECDDGNIYPFDGCFNCQYQCEPQCQYCVEGKCVQCEQGFYLNKQIKVCEPICGDMILVGNEECDDGNDSKLDGCFECKQECDPHCTSCIFGVCYECNNNLEGWYLLENRCQSRCGDGIVVPEFEECEGDEKNNCINCQYQCQNECNLCYQGICVHCAQYWMIDIEQYQCKEKCGDLYSVGSEQCDDGNSIEFDGCHNCINSCQLSCLLCEDGQCLECQTSLGWYLAGKNCQSICGDGIVAGQEYCDDGNDILYDGCFDCQFQCQPECEICHQGICKQCQTGYQYNFINQSCESICGDELLVGLEICDDGIQSLFGCQNCKYYCSNLCSNCVQGLCLECLEGYVLNSKTNQCQSICSDLIVIGQEECDDGNLEPNDGCFQCQYSCQKECSACELGLCLACRDPGWYLNQVDLSCQPQCGDQIVAGQEQCDDGNLIQFDGCFDCYLECQMECTECFQGLCKECDTQGWKLNQYHNCIPICGDLLVKGDEECDDGNLTPYDGCFECKYQCQEQCQNCLDGECIDIQCNTDGWYLQDNQCFTICGDGITIYEFEECDDGNQEPYDGCFECQFQCEQVCTQCISGICVECDTLGWQIKGQACKTICGDGLVMGTEQCDDMNDLRFDGCYNCEHECQQNCIDCVDGVCFQCDIGLVVYGYECLNDCGDGIRATNVEECDDGNNIAMDGCSPTCEVETDWICKESNNFSNCFFSKAPEMSLNNLNSKEGDTQIVKIKFSELMRLKTQITLAKLEQTLKSEIIDLNEVDYNITAEFDPLPTETPISITIKLTIQFFLTVNQPTLKVTIMEGTLVSQYQLELADNSKTLRLKSPLVLSQSAINIAEKAGAYNQVVIFTCIGISSLSLLSGNLDMFWNLMDMLQFISYVKYINIDFPPNLDIYFECFKLITISPALSFFQVDKILNLLNNGEDPPYIEAGGKFKNDEINCYFLENFQSVLFCILSAYISYICSKILVKYLYKISPYQLNKLGVRQKYILKLRVSLKYKVKQFYYQGILRLFMANYYDLSFATLIQLTSLSTISIVTQLNYALAALVFMGQLSLIVYFINSLQKFCNRSTLQSAYAVESIFDGIDKKSQNIYAYQFNSILLIKKTLFIGLIIVMQQDGACQTICVSLLQSFFVLYLFSSKPLTNQFEYRKYLVSETLTIFNTLSFLIYKFHREFNIPTNFIVNLGWIHIFSFSSILAYSLVSDVYQQISQYITKYKKQAAKDLEKMNSEVILFY